MITPRPIVFYLISITICLGWGFRGGSVVEGGGVGYIQGFGGEWNRGEINSRVGCGGLTWGNLY